MIKNKYIELIQKFKQNDNVNKIIFADDIALVKILISTQNIEFYYRENKEFNKESWDDIWENTFIEKDKLYKITNFSNTIVDRYMSIIVGNKIIYPDGLISGNVEKYIKSMVVSKFPKEMRKKHP